MSPILPLYDSGGKKHFARVQNLGYRASAASARSVLMDIELEWQLKDELATFRKHGQVGSSRYGLHNTQIACVVVLMALWIILLISLHNN